jgi:hypothetical protein
MCKAPSLQVQQPVYNHNSKVQCYTMCVARHDAFNRWHPLLA